MTGEEERTGSEGPQIPEDRKDSEPGPVRENPPLLRADLRTLIQSRKESGKQMNLRLALLQAIMEGAGTGIFSLDAGCRFTSFNQSFARLLRDLYGAAINHGDSLADHIAVEKDRKKILDLISRAYAGNRGTFSDYLGDQGHSRGYFDLEVWPVKNEAGAITGIAGMIADRSAARQAERVLQDREAMFRRLADDASGLVCRYSLPGMTCEYVSPSCPVLTGYSQEEFIRNQGVLYDLVCSSHKDSFGRILEDLRNGKNPPGSELRVSHRNGETRLWHFDSRVVRDPAGHPVAWEGFITDITGQKAIEAALIREKERFRTIVESADTGILLVDARTHVIADANPRALEMLGMPREQVIGSVCHRFICPAEDGRCPVTDLGEKVDASERSLITAEKGTLPVLKTVVRAEIDGRNMLVESFTDLSEQKKSEDALRKSEEQYRDLFEHSVDIICTLTPAGEISSINRAVLTHLGYQPGDVIGKNVLDYLRPEVRLQMTEETERIRKGGRSAMFHELEILDCRGKYVPFEVNICVRNEGAGSPGIIGIAREISERKKTGQALRESEERFRFLLQSVPGIAVQGFRTDYTITYWNDASTALFGYTADEATGRDIRDLLVPPELHGMITGTCDGIAASGIPGPSHELELRHRDGHHIPVLVSHAVVTIPGKDPLMFCIGMDLTEQKAAEQALRDAERRVQSILDAAPFGTFVFELRGNGDLVFVSGNRSAEKILGTSCAGFAGRTVEDAFPELAATGIPDAYRAAARTGTPYHADAVAFRAGGISGIFEVDAVPLGQHRVTIFFRDISEKRKAEEERERSETRFRALIQNSSDIIQILDRDKKIVFSSPAFAKILGFPEGSWNGKDFPDYIHPDDRERVSDDLAMVYSRTNPGTPTEYRFIAADGNFRYVESVGVNLLDVPGVDGIVINTHTVHQRKLAEHALQESEERFRLIFQHSSDAIYLFEITPHGMPGKIVDANDGALIQSGYSRNELLGRDLLQICSHDLSRRSRSIMMELLTRGEARFETEKIKKDGAILPVEISARLAKLKNRNYVIAISRDISQRKREERALRISNQKLQLMNIVAWHDIQNKVTGLRGYVALSKDLVTDARVKKFIESEEDVLGVIHRQLQYTREYQEMGVHPPRWIQLPELLRTIISFRGTGSLKFSAELNDLELYCDPVIEKVFAHLIENTRNHGKTATGIRVSCRENPGGLVIVYEDNGIGIPAEKKKDLFVRGVGSATGFSLFFIHDILEISDMTIQETGEPGKGVRFEISVPRGLYRIGSPAGTETGSGDDPAVPETDRNA